MLTVLAILQRLRLIVHGQDRLLQRAQAMLERGQDLRHRLGQIVVFVDTRFQQLQLVLLLQYHFWWR